MDNSNFRELLSKYCLSCLGIAHNPAEEDVVRFFQGSKKAHLVLPASPTSNKKWLILFDKQSDLQHYLKDDSYQQLTFDSSYVTILPCRDLHSIPSEWEECVQLVKEGEETEANQQLGYGKTTSNQDSREGDTSAEAEDGQATKTDVLTNETYSQDSREGDTSAEAEDGQATKTDVLTNETYSQDSREGDTSAEAEDGQATKTDVLTNETYSQDSREGDTSAEADDGQATKTDVLTNETYSQGISLKERRIVLIGKTGSGKSETGNTILGESDAFESTPLSQSITKKCKRREVERNGWKLMVVDTPGLFDTKVPNERTKEEIGKCIGITSPGPHAIVLVIQINRFTDEEQKTVDLLAERFGKGIYNHLIILFTRKDDLTRKNIPISEYVQGTEQLASILQKCQNRYIAFDNFSKNKDEDVESLLIMIEDIVEKNGGKCYTNDMFIEAEKAMKRRMDAIREEERKKKEQELKDHKEKLLKRYEAEINTHEKAIQQSEKKILESKCENELEKQLNQEDGNKQLRTEKKEIENQRQKGARDFEETTKLERKEKEKDERIKRKKKEQEKQAIDELQKQLNEHLRRLMEGTEREKWLAIKLQKELDKYDAEIADKYKRKMDEKNLRNQARDEVEERGFLRMAWDFVTFKWFRDRI